MVYQSREIIALIYVTSGYLSTEQSLPCKEVKWKTTSASFKILSLKEFLAVSERKDYTWKSLRNSVVHSEIRL